MMGHHKIIAINPGSTSTKLCVFEDEKAVFMKNISHDAQELQQFDEIKDQLEYRKSAIVKSLQAENIGLENTDAFVGRGGGLVPLSGGIYSVNDILLDHARKCLTAKHPATLGSQIARSFSEEFGGICLVVNPPDVDEFMEKARITGLKGIYRESRCHALNQKEVGLRYARKVNRKYDELNLIIAHIGGGVSVTAHQKGKMIDSNDIVNGDGPFAPTRAGSIPASSVVDMCFSGMYSEKEIREKIVKTGGLVSHLNTSEVLDVLAMIEDGHAYAKLVLDAMSYQIGKFIGAMAVALEGKVDAIILTGGISRSELITGDIKKMVDFIAPVEVNAGEFEMEALASGALRILRGEEKPKEYTGIPVWSGEVYEN